MFYDVDILSEIEESLQNIFNDDLLKIISMLNRKDQLEEFLELISHQELIPGKRAFQATKEGKIIVVGYSDVKQKHLEGVIKEVGLDKERFEFYLDYEDGIDRKVKSWQWNPKVSAILVGPMPHSGGAKGDYGSVISAIEQEEGYPPVARLGKNGLCISKSDFKDKLMDLIDTNIIKL